MCYTGNSKHTHTHTHTLHVGSASNPAINSYCMRRNPRIQEDPDQMETKYGGKAKTVDK